MGPGECCPLMAGHLDRVHGVMVNGLVEHESEYSGATRHGHANVALLLKEIVQLHPLKSKCGMS